MHVCSTLLVLQATSQHLDGVVEDTVHPARVDFYARVNGAAGTLEVDLCSGWSWFDCEL